MALPVHPGGPVRPGKVAGSLSALPRWVYLPATVGAAFVALPLVALGSRTDWSRFGSLISSPASLTALSLSLRTAALSTVLCLLFGVPLAMTLARHDGGGVRVLRSLVLLPLVLPPVVGGLALLYTFGRLGLLGHTLQAAGIRIAFTTAAVVLAQTFVSLPFLVIALEGVARGVGRDHDVAAATLGARPGRVWWTVTLPLLAPGLLSGAVLAFARALGEFGATLTFAGSRPGVTRTLPLEIYLQREADPQAAVALSMLLVGVAAVIVVAVGARQWRT